ncbi:hypothetical protein QQF64_018818 [Cirrhinus molitorella]|uniref:Uncharacterized protein n=1 Tax=Cirrhinus molitorella TaxID=172907 RepID=A0ABR3LH73_9TELE
MFKENYVMLPTIIVIRHMLLLQCDESNPSPQSQAILSRCSYPIVQIWIPERLCKITRLIFSLMDGHYKLGESLKTARDPQEATLAERGICAAILLWRTSRSAAPS